MLRSLSRVVAVNLGLLVLGLVVAELIFGTWLWGPSFGALNLPREVERRFAMTDEVGAEPRIVHYSRDRFGLRGRYDGPAAIGILAVGGSTTNEMYVSDGETWTDRLAARFRAANIPVNVVNAGAEGQSTVGHLHNFDAWFPLIPGLKFRYLLAYVGVNDMALGARGADPIQLAYDRGESSKSWRRARQYLANHSALYRLWRTWRGAREARVAGVVHGHLGHARATWIEAPAPAVSEPEPGGAGRQDRKPGEDSAAGSLDFGASAPNGELARRLEGYAARVGELIRRARGTGAEAIIVTQTRAQWRRDGEKLLFMAAPGGGPDTSNYAETALFNRAAMAACRQANAICLDLGGEIEFQPGDFYDWVHTTPQGSARIADYLFARLKDKVR
jgi:hypothetical protein